MGLAQHVQGIDARPDLSTRRGHHLHAKSTQVFEVVRNGPDLSGESHSPNSGRDDVAPRGVETADQVALARRSAVGRSQARASDVLGGNEGLSRPSASREPEPASNSRGYEPRQDPVLALPKDTRRPDDDDLELAR